MKVIFSISILLLLAGCSSMFGAVYDNNERAAFASIATIASLGKTECENKDNARFLAAQLKAASLFSVFYTKYEQHNTEVHKISQEIKKLTDEFANGVEDKHTAEYCKIKLDLIQHSAEVAMRASASKRRAQ